MEKKKDGLAKMAGLYGIANLLNSLIPVLFIPILTRYLTRADYGILANFEVLIAFMNPLVGIGIHSAIMRQYYEKDRIDLPAYITNSMMIVFFNALFISCIVLMASQPLSHITKIPAHLLWIVVITAFGEAFIQTILVLWRSENKPVSFGIFRILQSLMNFGLSIYFIVGKGWHWEGRFYAVLWTWAAFGLIAFILMVKHQYIRPVLNWQYIKHSLKYSVPLIPHSLGVVIRTMTDRLFITNMVGVGTTGLYAVGYQVGKVIGFLENTFNMAWKPWLFEQLKKNDEEKKKAIVRFSYIYMVVITGVALSFSLLAPPFMSFFVGKNFQGASIYVVWIAMGYAFNGMYKMVCNYIFFVEKTHLLSL